MAKTIGAAFCERIGAFAQQKRECRRFLVAAFLRSLRRMSLELLIGRGLALCVHPMAAWRVLSTPGRAFVISAYAVGAYVTVLGTLLLTR